MWKSLLAMVVCASPALAQVDAGAATTAPGGGDLDDVRREVDRKVDIAKKEMREEIRAQLATQSAAQGWQEEWVEQNRKLDLLELNGYFRVRPDLFNKFDLNRIPDPDGYTLWPQSPVSTRDRTQIGANMRLRLEPTLNVSEEVRIKMQMDVLDNMVFGASPDYALAQQQREGFSVFSTSQAAPVSSISVKRIWGEVSTPVGILRFGRMGSQWGLGMLHNDGNCLDCDHGETVDRVMFVAEPLTGYYVTPMIDTNLAGLTTQQVPGRDTNAPYPLSNSDQTYSFVLALARRDTDQQAKAKLENNQAVFNYGLHFTYRVQHADAVDFYNNAVPPLGAQIPNSQNVSNQLSQGIVDREASLYMPDIWVKYERKAFRIEGELAAVLGNINNRALSGGTSTEPQFTQALSVAQVGGVLQGEYRFLDGSLKVGLELGFASGDPAPGMGVFPNRPLQVGTGAGHPTVPGDIDGAQYACQSTGTCSDASINNFVFARDYRIDNILFRELMGGISDTLYAKPTIRYQIADGFDVFGAVIGSRAQYKASTPGYTDPYLGVELNAGVRYETEDGFFAQLTYAILFPLGGLQNYPVNTAAPGLDNAQALRAMAGIKF